MYLAMCRLAACLVFARPEADRYPAGGFNRRKRDLCENKARRATVSAKICRPPGFVLICQRNPAAEAAGRLSVALRAVSGDSGLSVETCTCGKFDSWRKRKATKIDSQPLRESSARIPGLFGVPATFAEQKATIASVQSIDSQPLRKSRRLRKTIPSNENPLHGRTIFCRNDQSIVKPQVFPMTFDLLMNTKVRIELLNSAKTVQISG